MVEVEVMLIDICRKLHKHKTKLQLPSLRMGLWENGSNNPPWNFMVGLELMFAYSY
jgi:hypothetical protein